MPSYKLLLSWDSIFTPISALDKIEVTANILVAYARAAFNLYVEGEYGVKTVIDVPTDLLSVQTAKSIIERWLSLK